jgi:hypothetical protein
MKPQSVTVSLGLPFGLGSISGSWGPDDAERKAAWEMYVELVTRVSVEALGPSQGLLREALTSLYSLFDSTRDILRRYGPEVAIPKRGHDLSFGAIAVAVLNRALRPLLARWHPEITHYESTRGAQVSPLEHERNWNKSQDLRAALEEVRKTLVAYADLLGEVAGVPSLIQREPEPSQERG